MSAPAEGLHSLIEYNEMNLGVSISVDALNHGLVNKVVPDEELEETVCRISFLLNHLPY